MRRPYRMTRRADSAAATRSRVLAAAVELFMERFVDEITLRDVAARAGVGLQTLVRHFGSRDELIEATARSLHAQVERERFAAPVGNVRAAVAVLVEHYERDGPRVLRALAQEDRLPVMHGFLERGREAHRRWTEVVFEPLLPVSDPERALRIAQLSAIADVYTWKLLRHDHGLDRTATEAALVEMIRRVTGEEGE